MGKTLYVSDLDGTLLTPDQDLSPFTCRVLNRLTKAGGGLYLRHRQEPGLRGEGDPGPDQGPAGDHLQRGLRPPGGGAPDPAVPGALPREHRPGQAGPGPGRAVPPGVHHAGGPGAGAVAPGPGAAGGGPVRRLPEERPPAAAGDGRRLPVPGGDLLPHLHRGRGGAVPPVAGAARGGGPVGAAPGGDLPAGGVLAGADGQIRHQGQRRRLAERIPGLPADGGLRGRPE